MQSESFQTGCDLSIGTLLSAVRAGKATLVERLLKKGVDPNGYEDADELTPLYYAVSYRAPASVFESLVRHGADLNRPNAEKLTPLAVAKSLKEESIVQTLLSFNCQQA